MLQQLNQMGFDYRRAEMAIQLSNAKRVDDTLGFLVKSDLGWEHPFLPSEQFSKLCLICQDTYEEHLESIIYGGQGE